MGVSCNTFFHPSPIAAMIDFNLDDSHPDGPIYMLLFLQCMAAVPLYSAYVTLQMHLPRRGRHRWTCYVPPCAVDS